MRLTKRRLLDGLMELLESPRLNVTRRNLKREQGLAYYDRHLETGELIGMRVIIDVRNAPVVTTMVHELLHLYMAINYRVDLDFVDALEEPIIQGMTNELTSYLHKPQNNRLFQRWIRAVEKKLA